MYIFGPPPAIQEKNRLCVTQDDFLTEEELDVLEKYCSKLIPIPAKTYDANGNQTVDEIRRCTFSALSYTPGLDFFFERISKTVQSLNAKNYNFDLAGIFEPFQYLQYDCSILGHYDSHVDSGAMNTPTRKISIVIQMSDPSEYEGGELQLFTHSEPYSVSKKKGRLVIFPSYMLHRVTPVTKGLRKTIVGWISGPAFR